MNYCVLKTSSKGYGIFSNKEYQENDFITQYAVNQKTKYREIKPNLWETHFCRYCNHNSQPNTKIVKNEENWEVISNEKISIGDEILVNYKDFEILLGVPTNTFYRDWFEEIKLVNFKVN